MSLPDVLLKAEQHIAQTCRADEFFEVAFFGGTFTALPEKEWALCMQFAERIRQRFTATVFRCSTRPDALPAQRLSLMKDGGFTTIELGVQSFSNEALYAVQRGYTGECARDACALVRDSGFALGIQLMPGLPGQSQAHAVADVELSVALAPAMVRLYPCLVLEGTALAHIWRQGGYTQWADTEMRAFLARACLQFWRRGIPVIRLGVAHESAFEEYVLAGTRHPALGSMIRAEALQQYVFASSSLLQAGTEARFSLFPALRPVTEEDIQALPSSFLRGIQHQKERRQFLLVPQRYSGEFWGHARHLEQTYAKAGLPKEAVAFWRQETFCLLQR